MAQEVARPLEIHRLTGEFYVFITYKNLDGVLFPSNGMYVVTDSGVVMIDTPWNEEETQPLLDSIENRHGKKVTFCISTHHHDDRSAGLNVLKAEGVSTWSSRFTRYLCRKKKQAEAEFVFETDTVFVFGDLVLQTYYPGAGHTHDNITIWFPREKIYYGGCFVKSLENHDLGYIADAFPDEWPVSIKRAMSRYPDISWVIPGHFAWGNRKLLKHTYRLLKKRR